MDTQGTVKKKKARLGKYSPLPYLKSLQSKISAHPALYLIGAFILPAFIMYAVYLAMEIHPFGDGSVLVLDLNGQYVYFFEALRSFIHGDTSLLYSFSRTLGGEFMGIYAYYIASPLSYIVALFPKDRMLEALLTIILLKTGLCGYTFGYYLHKNSKTVNKMSVIIFSTMYALCAYAVVYQNNIMWIDALIWLPLITYGIEQLVKFGKYKLFVISLSLAIMSNFYIGYMVCIYVALYFFYYSFAYSDNRNNPLNRKHNFLRSLLRIALFSLIAVAISAVIIFTAYYALTFGKTTFTDPNWKLVDNFPVLDFLTKFLPGSYDTVRPEGLPNVYAGVLMLILIPVYFMAKKISTREKLSSLIFILLFILSFLASPIDLIWHGFQRPNWLNYRYSFMLVFFMLTLAYKGFGNLRRIGEKFLLGVGAIIILFVAVAQKQEFETYVESEKKLLSLGTVWATIIAVIALVAVLCLLIKTKNVYKRESICWILAAVVCIELFCSSLVCVMQHDGDVAYSGYSGYNDHLAGLRPIADTIQAEDLSFYRAEKTAHRTTNDNMALGLRGLSNSTSTLNSKTIKLLSQMGYCSVSHWSKYDGGTPVNDSIFGIKYIIDKDYPEELGAYYQKAYTSGEYTAYLNPYALSIAYGVDDDIKEFDIGENTTTFTRLNKLVGAMLGTEAANIFKPITVNSKKMLHCYETPVYQHYQYSNTSQTTDGQVIYNINAAQDGEIFMQLATQYPREATVYVNGVYLGKALDSGSKTIMSIGYFEKGEKVEVAVEITNEYDHMYISSEHDCFYYIDRAAFESAFSTLKANPQFIVNQEHTDDTLEGTIKTENDDQMILTTIPYDKGWKVMLDGEEIETYETLDSLIAFDIKDAGEHTLTLKYRSDAFVYGLGISIGATIIFALICIADHIITRIRRRKYGIVAAPEDIYWDLEDFDEDREQYLTAERPLKNEKTLGDEAKELIIKLRSLLQKKDRSNNTKDTEKEDNDQNDGGN